MKKSLIILKILAVTLLGLFISCSSTENNEGDGNSSSSVRRSSSSVGGSSSSVENSSGSSEDSSSSVENSSDSVGDSSSSSAEEASSSSTAGEVSSSSSADEASSSSSAGGASSSSSSNRSSSSSSAGGTSSSSFVASEGCKDEPKSTNTPVYGADFTDTRDNQTYKTVIIGTQTWMAENLNYKPSTGTTKCYAEGAGNGVDDWLPPNDPQVQENCNKYGRLYDWAAAQNACPQGWSLPDTTKWEILKNFVDREIFCNYENDDYGWDVGTKLKATTGWDASSTPGVESYGFGAIGTGYCVSWNQLTTGKGYFEGAKKEAHWWSATEYVNTNNGDKSQAYKYKMTYNTNVMDRKTESKTDYLYSVRCVRN